MAADTREKLMNEAEALFVRRGFYGTSINDVASAVGVSKQGLLHHFPTKEKPDAAVLQRAAEQLRGLVAESRESADTASAQVAKVFQQMSRAGGSVPGITVLLMRELLDNRERIDEVHQWFMRPFLDDLVALVEAAQAQGNFQGSPALAFVYQLLGAIQYYLISVPTLKKLYTEKEFRAHEKAHYALLENILNS